MKPGGKRILFASLALVGLITVVFLWLNQPRSPLETKFVQTEKKQEISEGKEPLKVEIVVPGKSHLLPSPHHVYQTFNNCGPATLSMALSFYGIDVSQKELGEKMRPYQNPKGNNDDKTIFPYEFAEWTNKHGLEAVYRPNGDIGTIKRFTTNGFLVVTKTWLNVDDDIGHFRVVRGFDEDKKTIIQDDSYHGPNKKISYYDFLSMWQPFNYTYIIIYPKEKEELVNAILGEERDAAASYLNSIKRAKEEVGLRPENIYPWFNLSTAYYHTQEFKKSIEAFEKVEGRLPRRMLWYQIEPIKSYFELGEHNRVFQITDKILNTGNRAFPELYQIRGEIYLKQGNKQKAKEEFEKAIFYNKDFSPAQEAMAGLESS